MMSATTEITELIYTAHYYGISICRSILLIIMSLLWIFNGVSIRGD